MNSFDALPEVYLWRQRFEKSPQASFGICIYPLNLVVSLNTCTLTERTKALCDTTRLGGKYKCRKMPAVIFQNVGAKGKLLEGHRKNSCLRRKDIFHEFDRADVYKL